MTGTQDQPIVFISYRISDTNQFADRLASDLEKMLAECQIFLDRNIDGGETWPTRIRLAIESAKAVLVLVGSRWLKEQDEQGRQRIAMKNDWVRLEVATALQRGPETLVIPVFVEQQQPIKPDALDHIPDIVGFADLQGLNLRTNLWDYDVDAIVDRLTSFGFRKSEVHIQEESHFVPASRGLFVGREHSLTALERLISEEAVRLGGQRPICLVGTGGVGKTTLAKELIRRIGNRYDRVIEMSRPPEGHPKKAISVFREWARDIGIAVDKEYSSSEIRSHLAEHYKSLLVLIDDAWIGDLTELRMINDALPANTARLITTRDKNVSNELNARFYPVGPMPDSEAELLIREQLLATFGDVSAEGPEGVKRAIDSQKDAIDLFIHRVEGHPLAIRLGIGSCNSLPEIEEVVQRLVASLKQGVNKFRTAALAVWDPNDPLASRNQSLVASLGVGFDDMVMDDRRNGTDYSSRFRALGVFPEGCKLDGNFIHSVWGDERNGDNDLTAQYSIKALVDRCFLSVDVDSGKYSVQSVLRAFAIGLLNEQPIQLKAVRLRYHRLVVKRAMESYQEVPLLWSATDYLYPHLAHVLPEMIGTLEQLSGSTLDNLAASSVSDNDAIDRLRCEDQEYVMLGKGLSEGFRHAASRRLEWGDTGIRLLKLGLLCARVRGDHNEVAEYLGRLADRYTTRNSPMAEDYFVAALEVARTHSSAALADILTYYAEYRRTKSEWVAALKLGDEALALHRQTVGKQNELREAKTLSIMGEVLWRMSKLDEAAMYYELARVIYEKWKDEKGEADIFSLKAANEFNRGGRYEEAIELFKIALEKHTKLKDLAMKAQDLNDIGACNRYLGRYEVAEKLFNEALELNRIIGNRRLEAINTCNISGALLAQRQFDLAIGRADDGRLIGEEIGDRMPQVWGLIWKGMAFQGMGEFNSAENSFKNGLELAVEMGNPREQAGATGRLGLLYCDDMGRNDEGIRLIKDSIKILRDFSLKAAFSNLTVDELEQKLKAIEH